MPSSEVTQHDANRVRTLPIEEYAAIGNGRTIALVGSDLAIDWCCLPRIDSSPLLDRLLDPVAGAFFALLPVGGTIVGRRYLEDTNVLVTEIATAVGTADVLDHMATGEPWIVRTIRGHGGTVTVRCTWRCGAGSVRRPDPHTLVVERSSGAPAATALAPAAWEPAGDAIWCSTATVEAGEERSWVLGLAEGRARDWSGDAPRRSRDQAARGDADWVAPLPSSLPFSPAVRRSALALRLLIHAPTGAIAAAGTTSLPEVIGGVRNWDYRYCWLRDAALVLDALMGLGMHDEAMRFWDWLDQLDAPGDSLAVLYAVDGATCPHESEIEGLPGYRDSRPVRIGNGAAHQEQHDTVGWLLDAAWRCQRSMQEPHPHLMPLLQQLADRAAGRWREPDRGIWEMRGPKRDHVHSKLMAWVALDRALRLADVGWLEGDVAKWRAEAAAIRSAILERGFDASRSTFVQTFGGSALDAAALLIPIYGLIPADDPRALGTLAAIENELGAGDLLRRYRIDDGLPGTEGAFVACAFWRVELLAAAGRRDAAHDLMTRLVARTNDVGLLSEEIDPATGAFLGNFPQALSHLALIRAALALA